MKNKIAIGDLVTFNSPSLLSLKNQIGIVISDSMIPVYDEKTLQYVNWYLVQFGTIPLIVSEEMIIKISV
jgi:hypothetical protein